MSGIVKIEQPGHYGAANYTAKRECLSYFLSLNVLNTL